MLSLDVRVFSSRSTVLHGQLPQACPSNGSIAVALLFAHAFNQDRVETDRIAQGSRYRRDAPQVPEWCGLVPIETHTEFGGCRGKAALAGDREKSPEIMQVIGAHS